MARKIGLWLIGAGGGVATTVAVGCSALKKGITGNTGLVSSRQEFQHLELVALDEVKLGGHEIRRTDAVTEAKSLAAAPQNVIDFTIVERTIDDLQDFQSNIRPGITINCGPSIEGLGDQINPVDSCADAVVQIQNDLTSFQNANQLDTVIVVNLASTEPNFDPTELPKDWSSLNHLLGKADCVLPSSCLYAIAAIQSKMPYINFTPSIGSNLPAIFELAEKKGVCHIGQDGKTGETFLKSVLAPAFAQRNLQIMSWVGHNIFGNMDGQILDDPVNKQTKVESKGKMLSEILGYQPQSHISIEYIKSLGDWKTAWDHIHFQGFLGTPMTMQFTWQGCDSILAAPLVIDLVRFVERSHRRGESGTLKHLASFFKSPITNGEHDFAEQYRWLLAWAKP